MVVVAGDPGFVENCVVGENFVVDDNVVVGSKINTII